MSWDLYLVPPEHAQDAGHWLETVAESPADSGAARRHGQAVRAQRPELLLQGPLADGGWQLVTSDEGWPLTVDLDGRSATVNVSFWDLGSDSSQVGDLLTDLVQTLRAQAGFVAYDPQEDRVVEAREVRELFERWHPQGVATAERIRHDLDSDSGWREILLSRWTAVLVAGLLLLALRRLL